MERGNCVLELVRTQHGLDLVTARDGVEEEYNVYLVFGFCASRKMVPPQVETET